MTPSPPPWSVRSVLVSVRDLDRSIAFYRDVLALPDVTREAEVAVLQGPGRPFAVLLRQAIGHPVRHGQQALGARSLSIDVGSPAELDEVAGRLEAAEAMVSRSLLHEEDPIEVVTGRDPDGLPVVFIAYGADRQPHPDHYRHVARHMYGIDL